MHPPHVGRVVTPPVMARAEAGDGVYVSCLQRFLELRLLKACPNLLNCRAGMEIEVDLTEAKLFLYHRLRV